MKVSFTDSFCYNHLHLFIDTVDTLWTCSWSSNGKLLAVSGADKVIRLYTSASTGSGLKLANELKGAHAKSIRSVSFCPRRMKLAAASFDGTVSIWSGSSVTGKWSCSATLEGHENEVKSVAWGTFMDEMAEEEQVFLATCGRDKTVWIWAVEESTGEVEDEDFECLAVLQDHEQDVKCLAWHPQRPLFLTGSYDESVLAWGPLNSSLDDWISVGKVAKNLNGTVWSVAFSPDGNKIAVALSTGRLILYTLPENWKSFTDWIRTDLQIFQDISVESTSSSSDCGDGEGCCGGENKRSEGSSSCCNDKSNESEFESENEGGCCGGGSNKMQVDSCCSSKKPRTSAAVSIPSPELYNLSWSPSSRFVAVACSDHSIKIVNCSEDKIEVCASIEGAHEGEVNSLAWSPIDENVLASVGDDGKLKIWRI